MTFRATLLAVAVVLRVTGHVFAADPISLHVPALTPGIYATTITVRLLTPKHPDNRQLCVGWQDTESPASYLSCWGLDGLASPTLTLKDFKYLPPGSYRAVAFLSQGSKVFRASAPFQVVGGP